MRGQSCLQLGLSVSQPEIASHKPTWEAPCKRPRAGSWPSCKCWLGHRRREACCDGPSWAPWSLASREDGLHGPWATGPLSSSQQGTQGHWAQ